MSLSDILSNKVFNLKSLKIWSEEHSNVKVCGEGEIENLVCTASGCIWSYIFSKFEITSMYKLRPGDWS